MQKKVILLLIALFLMVTLRAEERQVGNEEVSVSTGAFRPVPLKPRTKEQEEEWAKVPVWNPSPAILRRARPSKVDHSQSIHYRDRYMQCASCCASSSSIAFTMTYQINCINNVAAGADSTLLAAHHTWNHLNYLDQNGTWPNNAFSIAHWVGAATKKDFGYVCSNISDIGGNETQFKWLNGYDAYYRTMFNTTNGQERFKISDAAGIVKLKNWLYDMGGENEKGACAVFIANWQGDSDLAQTEDGKYYWSDFGNECQHAMTFCGYDDEFAVDFNRDGKITNDVDLNRDGIIDKRDWEKGAWIISDTRGKNWANEGTVYLPYRFDIYEDDIYIVRATVKKPKYTVKLDMTHNYRGRVYFSIGFANSENATEPDGEYIKNTFWSSGGGEAPMQGLGLSPDMELGLNLSTFAEDFTAEKGTFFFKVESEEGNGTMYSVAFRAYAEDGTYTEIESDKTDVELNGNSVEYIFNYEKKQTAIAQKSSELANGVTVVTKGEQLVLSSLDNMHEAVKFELFNARGQRLLSKQFEDLSGDAFVDKSQLPAGFYFYMVTTNGNSYTNSFIEHK